MFVYMDNAATTKTSSKAVKEMLPYFTEYYGNCSSLYEFGQIAKEKLEESRQIVADCLNANANEIYFTSGGSESDNQAILSVAYRAKKKGKNHIISTAFEHHAVLHTLKKLEKDGFEITLLPVYENGIVRVEDLKSAIKDTTALVTIMFANNEIGTIQPIKEIGAICRERGVVFHTDAVQAVGHLAIDVKEMNIDMLSLSAHKFHGPKGVGALFVKKGVLISPLIEGGAQEKGKRAGTENLAGIVGMAVALKDATENLPTYTKKVTELRDMLISGLSKIPHSKINGDLINRVPNNVNICFEGIEGESLLLMLDMEGICSSSGSACTSGSLDPSHVLLAIGLPHEVAHGSLRLSLSDENTVEEVEHVLKVVPEIVERLRKMSPVWDELIKGERVHVIQ
ncbi:MAG: cysteine desulfurase NifS [Clostridia bacterium]|nr:cysteine desulfurase NifS [Clostridia bacterium]